jgi:hypothetical protein
MTPHDTITLAYGLPHVVPPEVGAAWGAHFIFPDDLVDDRTAVWARDPAEQDRLETWLDLGALRLARLEARRLAAAGTLTEQGNSDVTLYQDTLGTIIGNPRRSFGYLYVVAYLFPHHFPTLDFT